MNLIHHAIPAFVLSLTACAGPLEDHTITDLYLVCDPIHNITKGCSELDKREIVIKGVFALPGPLQRPHVFPLTRVGPQSDRELVAAMHPIVLKMDHLSPKQIQELSIFIDQTVTVSGRLRTDCDSSEVINISDNDPYCGEGRVLFFDRFDIKISNE